MKLFYSQKPLLSFFVCAALPIVLIIVSINALSPKKDSAPAAKEDIEKYVNAGNYAAAEVRYRDLLQSNLHDIGIHRGYINAHFSQTRVKEKNPSKDDTGIRSYYAGLAASPDPTLRDIGNYGLGLIETLLDNYKQGAFYFGLVKDRRLPYFNNSYGYCLWKSRDLPAAEACFKREIMWGKNVTAAVANLASLWQESGKYDSLSAFLATPGIKGLVPSSVARHAFLHSHSYGAYALQVLKREVLHNTVAGFLAALFILAVWFVYFMLIDIFEPEKPRYLFLTLGLGMLSALFCTFLYDLYEYYGHFTVTGAWANDLLYCVFGIGLIEETVKVLPVIIIFRFTREINESLDILIYASISALGFAFMENLLYFTTPGLHAISGRAFSAVMMHMALSSIAVYGLMLGIYRYKRAAAPLFFCTFMIACALHGAYDFFLIGKGVIRDFSLISFFILIMLVQVFGRMLNNALNLSVFFSRAHLGLLNGLTGFLSISLSYIVLVQYLIMAAAFGVDNANFSLAKTAGVSWILILLIALNLSRFRVEKNLLLPLLKKTKPQA